MQQRFLPRTAGERQGALLLCLVLAPHRGALLNSSLANFTKLVNVQNVSANESRQQINFLEDKPLSDSAELFSTASIKLLIAVTIFIISCCRSERFL